MKSKFIKSTIILLIGGLLTKILSMVIRIFLTRAITTKGIGLYMLILPTFNLFITLSTFSLPISISKLISENKKRSKNIILSIIPVSLLYNFILMFILIIISPLISKYLLNNTTLYYPVMAISLTLPFICISNIIKGYFFGKERMFPYIMSNIIEQIVRLILTITLIPKLMTINLTIAIVGVVLINIVSELSSTITMMFFIPKVIDLKVEDFKYNKSIFREILNVSIPTTGSRLIGSITYFLEPIILTFVLLQVGYTNDFITNQYGIINGYVFPILLLPSFFTMAISNALLPVMSNNYNNNRKSYAKNKLKQAIIISLLVGVPATIILMIFPEFFLKLIYNTTLGSNYIRIVAPVFILHYIQAPLTIALQAMGKSKIAMKGTLYGSIIRTILLFTTSYLKIGIWGLIIATASNIIYITLQHLYYVKKYI